MRDDVAVAVEDVVDDLEQQPELVAERAPRRLLRLRDAGRPEPEPDRRGEEAAGLQAVQRRLVGRGARDVEVLAADHAERRLGQLARDGGVSYDVASRNASASSASPARMPTASP